MRRPLIIGHRGVHAYKLENTLPSFATALEMGVDGVECDVQETADRKLVVFHDYDLRRLGGFNRYVHDCSLDELRSVELINTVDGQKGLRIPTLGEYLTVIQSHSTDHYKPLFFVELKFLPDKTDGAKVQRVVGNAMEEAARHGVEDRTIFLSFYHPSMKEVKRQNPKTKIRTGALYEGYPINAIRLAEDTSADYLMPWHESVDRETVDLVHQRGLGVSVYTVDEAEDIKRMLEAEVDAITTNRPDSTSRIVKAMMK